MCSLYVQLAYLLKIVSALSLLLIVKNSLYVISLVIRFTVLHYVLQLFPYNS
jgi:hypothetical protein